MLTNTPSAKVCLSVHSDVLQVIHTKDRRFKVWQAWRSYACISQSNNFLNSESYNEDHCPILLLIKFRGEFLLFLQSIFHVAFLRGLFPDSYFKSTRMDNLEGRVYPVPTLFKAQTFSNLLRSTLYCLASQYKFKGIVSHSCLFLRINARGM